MDATPLWRQGGASTGQKDTGEPLQVSTVPPTLKGNAAVYLLLRLKAAAKIPHPSLGILMEFMKVVSF